MKVIFLDMDGVLNSVEFWKRRDASGYKQDSRRALFEDNIDPLTVARLNCIIDETGAKVVISSTWRKFKTREEMQEMLDDKGFIGEVIDMTLDFNDSSLVDERAVVGTTLIDCQRGHEIRHWLVENSVSHNVVSFVVLDDNSDMATVEHRFVQTDLVIGLSDADVERAVKFLDVLLFLSREAA